MHSMLACAAGDTQGMRMCVCYKRVWGVGGEHRALISAHAV